MLSNQEVSYLHFLDGEIRDAEAEMDYQGRCYSDLDNKATRTDKEEKDLRCVLKKIKAVNSKLTKLRNKKEEVTRGDFAREI